jgi:hypothetical protein
VRIWVAEGILVDVIVVKTCDSPEVDNVMYG